MTERYQRGTTTLSANAYIEPVWFLHICKSSAVPFICCKMSADAHSMPAVGTLLSQTFLVTVQHKCIDARRQAANEGIYAEVSLSLLHFNVAAGWQL